MNEVEALSPVEVHKRRRGSLWLWVALAALLLIGAYFFWRLVPEVPAGYADVREHFKYGSIGSEPANGIPYWVWKVLPGAFPEHLPRDYNDDRAYTACGFVQEEGRDTPIGFSKRRVYGIDLVGLNCAVCHTGVVRAAPGAERKVVLGMPANTMDLQKYFTFLFACAADPRFTENYLMAHVDAVADLDVIERRVYREAIPKLREALLERSGRLAYLGRRYKGEKIPERAYAYKEGELIRPPFGPGRVDTFNPYKAVQFNFPMAHDFSIGTADLPSLWNQQIRHGMWLHWDGNNDSVVERNKSAAMGAGVTPVTMDLPRMARIEEWCETLPPPRFEKFLGEGSIDRGRAEGRGKPLYVKHCAGCHEKGPGSRVGTVIPIAEIGTDPERLNSFTEQMAANMNTIGVGQPWRFNRFRKTRGYAAMPLDGVWLRAPYLHNGSVPTLRDLLRPPAKRPAVFYRGDEVYDAANVGFRSNLGADGNRRFFRFDTALPGNGNGGHEYGTGLTDEQKGDLLEYLKTL